MSATTLEDICVCSTISIRQALQVLNDGHRRIVLIVDDEKKLLGVVADSDIRRAILGKVSFDLPVSEIMVTSPVTATSDMSGNVIYALMQAKKCYEIPVLDHDGKVVGVRSIDAFMGQRQSTEVVIMAGGLGVRLEPLTHTTPKPLIPIGDKPILFVLLDQLILAGFRKITLALNYKADQIKEAITANPEYYNYIYFLEEKERLGTAGPLALLESVPEESFFVMNADLLTKVDFRAMLHFHQLEGNKITMGVREEKHQIHTCFVELRGTQL